MEYQMAGHTKLCGTCEYWSGTRRPNDFGTNVVLENQSVSGKCYCSNGPHARADRFSNYTTCSCYRKWSVLK